MRRRRALAAAVVVTAAFVLLARHEVRDTGGASRSHPATGADPGGGGATTTVTAPDPAAGEMRDTAFARHLRRRFGRRIRHGHTQVKAVEALTAYLDRFHPGERDARALDFLRRAFPDHADALEAQRQRLDHYNRWLEDHRGELNAMSARDRRKALWEARRETFGSAAEEIWEAETRNAKLLDAMDAIRELPDAPVAEKLDRYLDAVREAYGERAPAFLAHRQTELLTTFLAVDTVQDDLRVLSPDARLETLRAVRHAMGMDEEALARWRELDATRDRAWEVGERYMAERGGLGAGAELTALQDRLFGTEADVIRAEEASGFFRFARRRRIGRE